ncbi:hypothetical protein Leef1_34 [Polaribacter phage Leef_1]|uniref:Uncharacterized protein n=1 Tax=Polaribacter phage Leef_1 TaxID=2745684 RepID=A0A8E4ZM46_9CAUD|nr:hypothetical protein M1M28_gp34 [Polaribacter phage Leef_1]QQV91399.1 hypothetical protein Leef1_34 [Polaribacter phage Leef_1]
MYKVRHCSEGTKSNQVHKNKELKTKEKNKPNAELYTVFLTEKIMKAYFKKDGTLIIAAEDKKENAAIEEFTEKNLQMFYKYPIGMRKKHQ